MKKSFNKIGLIFGGLLCFTLGYLIAFGVHHSDVEREYYREYLFPEASLDGDFSCELDMDSATALPEGFNLEFSKRTHVCKTKFGQEFQVFESTVLTEDKYIRTIFVNEAGKWKKHDVLEYQSHLESVACEVKNIAFHQDAEFGLENMRLATLECLEDLGAQQVRIDYVLDTVDGSFLPLTRCTGEKLIVEHPESGDVIVDVIEEFCSVLY